MKEICKLAQEKEIKTVLDQLNKDYDKEI